jgi:hypothetical protein
MLINIYLIVQIISLDWGISSIPLKRPPLMQWKCSLIKGKASLVGHNLLIFCYLDVSEIWHDKSSSLWLEWSRGLTTVSHFWDRPVPIFSNVRFSYLALVQDKKITCVLPANACCTVYVNCPPQFSMLFLFKINNTLYISFQSFINTQILTISHIIT